MPLLNTSQSAVLYLPTPDGWKAELIWMANVWQWHLGYIPRWFTHTQVLSHPIINPAVHGWELNLWPIDHMSSVLTTTVAGHHVYYLCVLCRLVLSMLYYHLTERCWPQQAKMAASGSLKLMLTPCPRQSTTFCLLYHCILWVYVGGLQVSQWPRGIDEETQRRLVQIKQVITKCTKENQNARCQRGNELQRLQNEYMQGQLTQGQLFVIPYIQFFWSYIRLGWFAHVYISIV